uniref:Retrovirus-related Pol polyprotein from transposon TNT 1-94-like beta-barrel domain-containing protein n=1 Tax=Tanacetum cinerariifolium TaxID=118510 RepID=A0A6L2LCL3_TANCI|nr:hypothetical protein [Tanacetum cinerariifolium]
MRMKKGSSNTIKSDLSFVNRFNLNKNVKRYSRKNLMACNNSHHRDTRSAHAYNNARNAYCNSYDDDVNDLFVFDYVSIRKSHVSKMPFRKKPSASLNVPSRSKFNKSLPRIVRKWFPKLQPLAKSVGCSKYMTSNHALLMNFVENFLGTVSFGNNDFAVIAGYGDVVIGSMTIKKVYYVKGLGHNLFNVGQFCDKGLEVTFRKSTCFVRTEDGVDLLTGDRSSNLYTIALNKVASNSLACLPKMKFEKDQLCSACEQGKIHQKHHKSKMAFALNKPLYLLHMDLCGLMHVESINRKRYVLVVVDGYSRYTWVFFLHSKDEASESFESFQEESSSSSLNDDVQQSLEVVVVPPSNTQSILNDMIPNVDEASTSHNVFNERLEDAYFDTSTSFHDPSNVHTFYQPYPHEKRWTKDHQLYKIIGDPKLGVRTRGQLVNLCLLSSIEPANVAKALRDTDWVSAMQDELDQFARLKV